MEEWFSQKHAIKLISSQVVMYLLDSSSAVRIPSCCLCQATTSFTREFWSPVSPSVLWPDYMSLQWLFFFSLICECWAGWTRPLSVSPFCLVPLFLPCLSALRGKLFLYCCLSPVITEIIPPVPVLLAADMSQGLEVLGNECRASDGVSLPFSYLKSGVQVGFRSCLVYSLPLLR